ncbi:hypothetical protein H4R34_005726, partial [Dimargaris verticillata]
PIPSMSSLRRCAPQRPYKERGQLASRRGLGALEKRRDVALRTRDRQEKERQLKGLRERARNRNPDEFYFAMVNSQVNKDGYTVYEKKVDLTDELARLIHTQDLQYVQTQRQIERKKIERLQHALHIVQEDQVEPSTQTTPKHTVFVDDTEALATFDPAEHFNTVPELVGRSYNRPTREQLATKPVKQPSSATTTKLAKKRDQLLQELNARREREQMLAKAENTLQLNQALKGRDSYSVVDRSEDGTPVYKWKQVRKK